ncbi:MAG TPA: hypothetical protein VGM33_25430 [Baekduia sp.]
MRLQNLIMRVRPLRPTDRSPRAERRPHVFGRPAEVAPEPEPAPVVDHHLLAERRHRASVAPEDSAHYGCSCGYQFQAPVSTSVACPHCGTSQAW